MAPGPPSGSCCPVLTSSWDLTWLGTQDAFLPQHRCGSRWLPIEWGPWFPLVRKTIVQCAGRRCPGCCTALPLLPTVEPDQYVLPVTHWFGAWGEGWIWLCEEDAVAANKLGRNEQMLKTPDNSVCPLKVLMAVTPQVEEDTKGRSHL